MRLFLKLYRTSKAVSLFFRRWRDRSLLNDELAALRRKSRRDDKQIKQLQLELDGTRHDLHLHQEWLAEERRLRRHDARLHGEELEVYKHQLQLYVEIMEAARGKIDEWGATFAANKERQFLTGKIGGDDGGE